MTYLAILAVAGWLLAAYSLAVGRAEREARGRDQGLFTDREKELTTALVKLASRESKPEAVAKVIGDNAKLLTESFNETLTRLIVGYKPESSGGMVTQRGQTLDGANDEVTIPAAWIPAHEYDPLMGDDSNTPPIFDIPANGNGGWVDGKG